MNEHRLHAESALRAADSAPVSADVASERRDAIAIAGVHATLALTCEVALLREALTPPVVAGPPPLAGMEPGAVADGSLYGFSSQAVLSAPCPYCDARRGQWCLVGGTGHPPPHVHRVRLDGVPF